MTCVLYLDDDQACVRLVERILRDRPDVRLLTSDRGLAGIDLAREEHPDVVVSDLRMPDVPGDEVLRTLRGDEATEDIPVVILSADVLPERIDELLEAGAAEFLTKPFSAAQLLATVDRFTSA
jgi:CheY-like chemotaxis protein